MLFLVFSLAYTEPHRNHECFLGTCLVHVDHVVLTVRCNLLQELTKLRIINIEGIDKPETAAVAAFSC
jgi:hypothetical protein